MNVRRAIGLTLGLIGETLLMWAEILDPQDFCGDYMAWDEVTNALRTLAGRLA